MDGTIETTIRTDPYDDLEEWTQHVVLFPNHRGVSIVNHAASYGGKDGLYEIAPIAVKADHPNGWAIAYCEQMPDVVGYLTLQEALAAAIDASYWEPPLWGYNVGDKFFGV